MDDLVQWLPAQLDEEERIARAAAEETHPEWSPGDKNLSSQVSTAEYGDPVVVGPWDYLDWDVRQHIAVHDPARVLREIEAKRELLRLAERARDYPETFMNGFASAAEQVLRRFALAYADRPGYREEWRP
ncbi:DUF6221 family protein [Streptomyces sp. NPDC048242]|uniref:DUF6221 family protein n=1 Tax=Streptomyces sp. NPDC048242 TaxID=3155026 RepID=UPI003418A37F